MAERILIVDDDPLMCNLLTLTLHREGYETDAVYSGQDALDYLSGRDVDLILLDIMMADLNGIEVLRTLQTDPATASIPVIVLTARADAITQQTGLDAGAVEYLTKPIAPDDLVERVRGVFGSERLSGRAMPPIGIDYTAAYEQGAGIGRYVRELIRALAAEDPETPYRLFVAGASRDRLPAQPGANFSWRPTRITPLWFARLWHRLRLPLPVETFTGRVRLFHATDFTLPPTLPGTPTLLTVHDLSFVRAPETATPVLKAYLDRVVPRSVARATHVLADSQATKDDLIALYGTPPDKVTVLLSGVSEQFRRVEDPAARQAVRERYGIPPEPYILSVGTVQPRKNYARLMEALAMLGPSAAQVHLVIAGGRGWLDSPIYGAVKTLGLEGRVHFTGFVADEDLPALYSDALCLAYPSLYEGFGFPVLEAFACETPVVTSKLSSMPEVAGDAALLVDPYDVAALSAALGRLLSEPDLRAELVARGKRQVAQFTWQRTARDLRAVYERLAPGK